ncbi:hypothetical protein [Streptomyces sp. NPDC059893]|uniref:hypothetical protein n=1 Tax=Streptomyces sp. NPDC059893 TaxID=3346990 RepID=UPI0036539F21
MAALEQSAQEVFEAGDKAGGKPGTVQSMPRGRPRPRRLPGERVPDRASTSGEEECTVRIPGTPQTDDRPAVDVARERGIKISPFQQRPGETWGSYAARMGITRQETAKTWWEMTQRIDAAYGLPHDPEPDWTNPSTVAMWDKPPWLNPTGQAALRQGLPIEGGLATHLAPWERVQPAVEQISVARPAPTTLDDLVAQSGTVSSALGNLLPQTQQLPAVARTGMSPSTVAKYLKKGFDLAWEKKTLVLRTAGEKIIPVVNAVSTAKDVYDAVQWLRDNAVPAPYLPQREYQMASNSFIYRWPNGDVTAAPPP